MNDRRKIKLRRGGADPNDAVTAEYVRRAVAEALEANGLSDFVQWKTGVEEQLQILRVIAHDLRSTVALAHTNVGSARVKLSELLEGMMSALVNVDQMMKPGDVGELSVQQRLLERAFDSYRETPDQQNEEVEADDFDDPIEQIFDGPLGVTIEDAPPQYPPSGRRRRNRR